MITTIFIRIYTSDFNFFKRLCDLNPSINYSLKEVIYQGKPTHMLQGFITTDVVSLCRLSYSFGREQKLFYTQPNKF